MIPDMPLILDTPARHLLALIDDVGPVTLAEMARDYRHPIHADITRARRYDADKPHEQLMSWALEALGAQVVESDGRWSLAPGVDFGAGVEFVGTLIRRPPDLGTLLDERTALAVDDPGWMDRIRAVREFLALAAEVPNPGSLADLADTLTAESTASLDANVRHTGRLYSDMPSS